MIPLRDNVPRMYPAYATWLIIGLNAGAFLFEVFLPDDLLDDFVRLFGVVPARYLDPLWATWIGYPDSLWPFLTYMFLHAGFLHIVLNLWTLWIFADNVEDVMGHGRFLVFYLLCGMAALGLHMVFAWGSTAPIIGASGAVAGVMGAYIVLFPQGRVVTLIPILFVPLVVKIPAGLFLGVWFLIQLLSGLGAGVGGASDTAWWAHVGGFVAGMLLVRVFRRKDRCIHCYDSATRDYGFPDA